MKLTKEDTQVLNRILEKHDDAKEAFFVFASVNLLGENTVSCIGSSSGDKELRPHALACIIDMIAQRNHKILLDALEILSKQIKVDGKTVMRFADLLTSLSIDQTDNHSEE